MDDFRQNSPPWQDDNDGACSIGLLVAHALLFQCSAAYVCLCNAM
jgi:hypothetical protein